MILMCSRHIGLVIAAGFWALSAWSRMIPTCPCKDPPIEKDFYANVDIITYHRLALCIIGATNEEKAVLEKLVGSLHFELHFNDMGITGTNCNALLNVVKDAPQYSLHAPRHLCPGKCRPIPEIELPRKWLRDTNTLVGELTATTASGTGTDDYALTCTLSGRMIAFETTTTVSTESQLATVLNALFWRRLMECYERKHWYGAYMQLYSPNNNKEEVASNTRAAPPFKHETDSSSGPSLRINNKNKKNIAAGFFDSSSNSSSISATHHRLEIDEKFLTLMKKNQISIPKRKVRALIIWIGSRDRLWLTTEQARVLSSEPFSGKDGTIGWAATDEAYPCTLSTINCPLNRGDAIKYRTLPQSAVNYMPKGWGCAQRRPLRALAHTLWLVDPHFVITLDDDTFLNYDLLMRRYGAYLTSPSSLMATRPLIMGELGGKWGDLGHMTKWGMFAGGGGYILSRKAVEALMSYEVKYYPGEERVSRPRDMRYSDQWRSALQVYYLSVYKEGIEYSREVCPYVLNNGSEVTSTQSAALLSGAEQGASQVLGSSCVFTGKPVDKHLWRHRVRELSLDLPHSHPYFSVEGNKDDKEDEERVKMKAKHTATTGIATSSVSNAAIKSSSSGSSISSRLLSVDDKNREEGTGAIRSLSLSSAAAASYSSNDHKQTAIIRKKKVGGRKSYAAYGDDGRGGGARRRSSSLVGPIAVPLIDFCANLMANEHTCQHSDHSLGRCLIYGAFADPVSSGCKTTIPFEEAVTMPDPFYPDDPSGVKLGMCFMAPVCNISQHITCHRYKPLFRKDANSNNGRDILVKTERMSGDRGHYKVFSSSFNGSFIDSHM